MVRCARPESACPASYLSEEGSGVISIASSVYVMYQRVLSVFPRQGSVPLRVSTAFLKRSMAGSSSPALSPNENANVNGDDLYVDLSLLRI